jgi:FkbM family methyltransferase
MVTFGGLTRTLTVAREPHLVLLMKFTKKRKEVTFRNGVKLRLTWSQFRDLRDSYGSMQKYDIQQVGDDLFKVKFGNFDIVASLRTACPIGDLAQKYVIEKVDDKVFKIKGDTLELIGSLAMLRTFWELEGGEYSCDVRGKVVLDVGGFEGESAVFFSKMGAKKVIVYEPVKAHHVFIKANIQRNNVNAEIHEQGVGARNGTHTICYEETGLSFGFLSKGQLKMEINVRNIAEVITESGADVAKFDCEGAEKYLVHVPIETLKKIKFYMIEVHGSEALRNAIIKKFKASGFSLVKSDITDPDIGTIWLSLKK